MKAKEIVAIEDVANIKVVHISGHLDLESAPRVKAKLAELVKTPYCKIILDMEETSYISSFGLSLLLQLHDQVKAMNGRLVLAALHPFARQIFDTTQLSAVFTMYENVAAAVKALA